MPLPTPLPASASWPDEIARSAEREMKGEIALYDSVSNPGEAPTLVLLVQSKASIITLGISEAVVGGQWITKRAVRVKIPRDAYLSPIGNGTLLRVLDGGNDKTLEQFAYIVLAAANSSHAAVRSIECVSELVPVPAIA